MLSISTMTPSGSERGIKKMKILLTLLLSTVVASVSLFARAAPADDIETVRAELAKMVPAAANATIVASPVAGVFRLEVGGAFAYAYVDGDYVLLGDLLNTKEQVNLGDEATNAIMAKRIAEVPTSQMIVFGPETPKRYITVFTDIDCGYCRKLRLEVPELTKAGIEVRYLAFPRAGIGSGSYDKYVSVWCSEDQQKSLTMAKQGEAIPEATCDNPVASSYELGREVGVRGTPTIIFDDGTITPGYVQSDELIRQLGLGG